MSKLYLKYLELKKVKNEIYYLFKSGNFYLFLDEDAKKISSITTLKLTDLSNDIVKCGFPVNSLEKYSNIFRNLNLDVKIIEDFNLNSEDNTDKIIKKLKKIDINTVTPIKALNILNELKNMINV